MFSPAYLLFSGLLLSEHTCGGSPTTLAEPSIPGSTPLLRDTILSGWVTIGGGLIGLPGSTAKTKTSAPEGMSWQDLAPAGAATGRVIAVKGDVLYRLQPET
ncbi:hypothetical protein [Amycolatopsis sp. EV170708-02-1]|uniref:hypothetical protein n=1 Tax=Amycolatopsis sp. EV170708-02-1 TaxID=2919322 RepID=UPI001F0C462D|nr:hypothetical protein [Amycolatopsis sp. EV170708-02-1]UMP07226.1 hypothetical protein MJQ72_21515 [Amycolatopsis sp. EV170708-02-1]